MLEVAVPQELRLNGTVEAGGIKWPQRIQILQRGEPLFDLELTNFRTLEKFEQGSAHGSTGGSHD
jgi:hypothetical protein